jgi:hypothetical protein
MEDQKPDTKSPAEKNKTAGGHATTAATTAMATKLPDGSYVMTVGTQPQKGTVVIDGVLTVACPTPYVGTLEANVAAQEEMKFSEIFFRTYATVMNASGSATWPEVQQQTIWMTGQVIGETVYGPQKKRYFKVKFTGLFEATFIYPYEALKFVTSPPIDKGDLQCRYELPDKTLCKRPAIKTALNGKRYCQPCFRLATKIILKENAGRCPDCNRITTIRREVVKMGTDYQGHELVDMRDVVEPCVCKSQKIDYNLKMR